MNNEKLVDSILNELTYAQSILNVIINNNVQADQDLFNTIESVIHNISRAKKSAGSIQVENKSISISSFEIIAGESLETILGTATNTLKTAEELKVATESGKLKDGDTNVINLIQSVRLNLEAAYEKVSAEG